LNLGIFISSLPNELKAFGNSFSTTLITLLGQLPAPYLYGAIYNIDKTKKTAFNLTLFYSWFGVLFIIIGAIFRLELFKKSKKKEEASEFVPENNENEINKDKINPQENRDSSGVNIEVR